MYNLESNVYLQEGRHARTASVGSDVIDFTRMLRSYTRTNGTKNIQVQNNVNLKK